MSELAQWRSHKVVRAGKYRYHDGLSVIVEDINGANYTVNIPEDFFARGFPAPGDYIVIYDDGYKSWSPAKAFEEGYTQMEV